MPLRPLAAVLEPHPGVPGAAELLAHLLHNWWLAPDRGTALAVAAAARGGRGARHNIVTLQVWLVEG